MKRHLRRMYGCALARVGAVLLFFGMIVGPVGLAAVLLGDALEERGRRIRESAKR